VITMPRVRSDRTETVRVELGVYEREQLEKFLTVEKISRLTQGVGIGIGVLVTGMAAWYTGQTLYGWGQKVTEDLNAAVDAATGGLGAEVIMGRGTYVAPDGTEVNNFLAGVPILGSLFGSGIMIGQKFNPFD